MSAPLQRFGDWTVLLDESDLTEMIRQEAPACLDSPVIGDYPALVQCHVSGACDDDYAWIIITKSEADELLGFLCRAQKLIELWKGHSPKT